MAVTISTTISPKQLLKSYFETGDTPTETEFSETITGLTGCLKGSFAATDIVDGILTIDYGSVGIDVDGAEVDTDIEITRPLYLYVYPAGDAKEMHLPYAARVVTAKQCTVNIGSSLPTGNYLFYLTYFE